jgi:hypothetical protein
MLARGPADRYPHVDCTRQVRRPPLFMISNPGLVARVILRAVKATA